MGEVYGGNLLVMHGPWVSALQWKTFGAVMLHGFDDGLRRLRVTTAKIFYEIST